MNTANRKADISRWFSDVYEALWPRLDVLFPEFDFRMVRGEKWVGRSRLHLDGEFGRGCAGVTCWQNNPGRLIDYARGNMTIWQYVQTRSNMDSKALFGWLAQESGIEQPDGEVSERISMPVRNFTENSERLELLRKMRAARVAEARSIAMDLWNKAGAPDGHPYLDSKGLGSAPGVRRLSAVSKALWFDLDYLKGDLEDVLLVPLMDFDGLSSLQAIDKDGNKFFLAGGEGKGKWLILQGMADMPTVLCEGWATGVSIRESTGFNVVVAFNCGNLEPVAGAMLEGGLLSDNVLIAADNDLKENGKNPGLEAAESLANKTGWNVVLPSFSNGNGSDWNDYARLNGRESVAKCFGVIL